MAVAIEYAISNESVDLLKESKYQNDSINRAKPVVNVRTLYEKNGYKCKSTYFNSVNTDLKY